MMKTKCWIVLWVMAVASVTWSLAQAQPSTPFDANAEIAALTTVIQTANPGEIAKTEPFRAAAWAGVAACLERAKALAADTDPAKTSLAAPCLGEAKARVDALQGGSILRTPGQALDLLNLTGRPEAQVIVEYPAKEPGSVNITFLAGSIPVASVEITQKADGEEAREYYDGRLNDVFLFPTHPYTIGGRPAFTREGAIGFMAADWDTFDPSAEAVLLIQGRYLDSLPLSALDSVKPKAIICVGAEPAAAIAQVREWAASNGIPEATPDKLPGEDPVLIVGDPRLLDACKNMDLYAYVPEPDTRAMFVLDGDRVLFAQGASAPVLDAAVTLVLRGQPVTPEETEHLARTLASFLPVPESLPSVFPAEWQVFSGDVHSHTFFSDGFPSPAGLALQMVYAGMDYLVISDHDRIDGAQLAVELFNRFSVRFPLIVGEEITGDQWHVNAYPLHECIITAPTDNDPLKAAATMREAVLAAHMQGAVTQWNHPGFPASPHWKYQYPNALRGTACDAWEHIDANRHKIAATGTVKVFTGSSDTHNGLSSFERTLFLGPAPTGDNLAEAIRMRAATGLFGYMPDYLFGGDPEVSVRVIACLLDPGAFRAAKAKRLSEELTGMDLAGLVTASPAARP